MLFLLPSTLLPNKNIMNHLQNYDTSAMTELCSDLDKEITLTKFLFEKLHESNLEYSPMSVFFSSSSERSVACTIPPQSSYDELTVRLSEVLFLYSALKAHCVFVSYVDTYESSSPSLIMYLVSDTKCWRMTFNYYINNDNKVIWTEEKSESLADVELTPSLHELATVLFMHTHIDNSPFTSSEVLSYLSTLSCAIKIMGSQPLSYYDFSNNAV